MTPLWLIRFGNGVRRGSGISTTCYPAPAAIHGSLSSDEERLKLCLRVQTPAPVLGRTSRNRSGHPSCVGGASPRGGDRSPTPQPPTRAHLACGKDRRRAQDHSARALREPNFCTTRTDFTRDLAEAGRACLNNLLGLACGQDYCGRICLELLQTHAEQSRGWRLWPNVLCVLGQA